jgi:hypothetical protein
MAAIPTWPSTGAGSVSSEANNLWPEIVEVSAPPKGVGRAIKRAIGADSTMRRTHRRHRTRFTILH